MTELFGYFATILMGITLGLMGAGGSILTVPILVYIFRMNPMIATTYSLFIVGSTAFAGGLNYLKRKEIDLKTGFIFAIPSFAGVYSMKAYILPAIPDPVFHFSSIVVSKSVLIMLAFAVIMVAASFSMLKSKKPISETQQKNIYRLSFIMLQGFLVGSVAGFVGAGGGFLIIPALVVLIGMPMKIALGTSLFIIAANSLFGFLGGVQSLQVIDWKFLFFTSLLSIFGIYIGMRIAHHFSDKKLKKGFGYFVLIMGASILSDQIYKLFRS